MQITVAKNNQPHGTLLLPEEEYPEGGRWWEPIASNSKLRT